MLKAENDATTPKNYALSAKNYAIMDKIVMSENNALTPEKKSQIA